MAFGAVDKYGDYRLVDETTGSIDNLVIISIFIYYVNGGTETARAREMSCATARLQLSWSVETALERKERSAAR